MGHRIYGCVPKKEDFNEFIPKRTIDNAVVKRV